MIMREELKRELNKTYLLLSCESGEYEEAYELEMIVKNSPPTILPLYVMRMDGEIRLCYDITSKQTLREFMRRGKLPGSMVRELFEGIVRMQKEMKNHLLDPDSILLDVDHIYSGGNGFCFCYCPWQKQELPELLQKLLEELLGTLDYGDVDGIGLAYHLYQQSCAGDPDIEKILKEHQPEKPLMTEEPEWISEELPAGAPADETEAAEKKQGFFSRILRFFLKKEKLPEEAPPEEYPDAWEEISKLRIPGEEDCFGFSGAKEVYGAQIFDGGASENPTRHLDGCAETVVLGSTAAGGRWKLRPLLSGYEEFEISGESFLIGKNGGVVDGCIGRETISRIHSRLYVKDGRLFIADANSTNGTFVNGTVLPPGTDTEIFAGDRVLFADVGYECYNIL